MAQRLGGGIVPRPPKPPATEGFAPRPLSVIRLSYTNSVIRLIYTSLLNTSPQVGHLHFVTISLSYLPLAKSWLSATGHGFGSFILRYLCPTKVPILKISDDVIAYDLWSPFNQKSCLRLR